MNLGSGSQQQPDNGPLILPDNKKEDRAKKGKYRPAKLDIRPDEPAQVEAEMTPVISSQLKVSVCASLSLWGHVIKQFHTSDVVHCHKGNFCSLPNPMNVSHRR